MRPLMYLLALLLTGCGNTPQYDLVIQNGILYDGSGKPGFPASLAISSDTIAAIGELGTYEAGEVIDARGQAIAPGFINMLSWANESLLVDGRSQGDLRQGVTLEVLGEGTSMGPLNERMKQEMLDEQSNLVYPIAWNTLGEYLDYLEEKGISTNVASFVGNGTLREYAMDLESRAPTEQEMQVMKELLSNAMEEGAMGLSSSLIYVPSSHAQTDELIELARVAGRYDGLYISHIRGEEGELLDAVDELIEVADQAGIRSEIYHFKASGNANWHLLDPAIARIDSARQAGLEITTDMYTYPASSTGLNVILPQWSRDGGHQATMKLLQEPEQRARIAKEMDFHVPPEKILMVGFRKPAMRTFIGMNLQEVADSLSMPAPDAALHLIEQDDSRVQVVYFSMSEENLEKKLALPYMAICSDAGSYTTEGAFLEQSTHPRAYGSFARLLAHYVRERNTISLPEAIHRLSGLPAQTLRLEDRGLLKTGYYADVVVFDPERIQDHATFEKPHQYATGVSHVLVNGVPVISGGTHTGATPGRAIRGPGYTKNTQDAD